MEAQKTKIIQSQYSTLDQKDYLFDQSNQLKQSLQLQSLIEEEEMINQLQNLKKWHLFLERTDNEKPVIPSSIPIDQIVREYLNDDDMIILLNKKNILQTPDFESNISQTYLQWLSSSCLHQHDIDQFIQFWLQQNKNLTIQYSLYDDLNEGHSYYNLANNNYKIQQQINWQRNNIKNQKIHTQPSEKSNNKKKNKQPFQYLQKYFDLYCKKQVNSINNLSFEHYQDYYRTMCLTKWMLYLKEIGLLNYNKNASIQKARHIFVKYQDSKKRFLFNNFKNAVLELLSLIYNEDPQKIINDGYQLLGILNIDCFENKMKFLGVSLPKKVIKIDKNIDYPLKRRDSQHIGIAKLNKNNKYKYIRSRVGDIGINKTQEEENLNEQNLNNLDERSTLEKKRQQKGYFLISKLKKVKKSNFVDQSIVSHSVSKKNQKLQPSINLNNIIGEDQEDPYLRRFNDKENILKYQSISKRIDERIQKITTKYQ